MPKNKLTKNRQIVIPDVPEDLLHDIDLLAADEDRPRANYLRRLLAEIVAEKKAANQHLQAA